MHIRGLWVMRRSWGTSPWCSSADPAATGVQTGVAELAEALGAEGVHGGDPADPVAGADKK